MNRLIFLLLAVLVLAGCAPQGKTGSVTLSFPLTDTIVYASVITVSGTAQGVNSGGFIITLTDATGSELVRLNAPERDSAFRYELVHGYSGDPIEARLTLTAADAPEAPPYAVVDMMIAALVHRPEGPYAYITSPVAGDEMGGDTIDVRGRVSGLDAPSFIVKLVGSDGVMIDSAIVMLPSGYIADDIPWQVALNPKEITGSAMLQLVGAEGEAIEIVPIVLSSAAG